MAGVGGQGGRSSSLDPGLTYEMEPLKEDLCHAPWSESISAWLE